MYSISFLIMANAWIDHVKSYQKKHGCSYKIAMKEAKKTYKGGCKTKPKTKTQNQKGGNFIDDINKATKSLPFDLPFQSIARFVNKPSAKSFFKMHPFSKITEMKIKELEKAVKKK